MLVPQLQTYTLYIGNAHDMRALSCTGQYPDTEAIARKKKSKRLDLVAEKQPNEFQLSNLALENCTALFFSMKGSCNVICTGKLHKIASTELSS